MAGKVFALPDPARGTKAASRKKGGEQEGNGPIDSRAKLIDSDCKFYFIFEINNLRYPNIYEHVASNSHSDGP